MSDFKYQPRGWHPDGRKDHFWCPVIGCNHSGTEQEIDQHLKVDHGDDVARRIRNSHA